MAKFRKTNYKPTITVNRAGGEAYKQTDKLELVSLLLTSFVADQFYRSSTKQLERLRELVIGISDKKFVAKSAIYARTKFGMRSITHALVGELVRIVKGQKWTKNAIAKAIYRPDDMLEILSYYLSNYGKPIPNSLKKGLRLAINNFDEYQLAKYRGERSSLKLVDLVNLIHPKPKKELEDTFKKLINGELKSVNTWETKLTKAGQEVKDIEDEQEKEEKLSELKKQSWKELIESRKIGYFALLRNLRNIVEQAPEMIDKACEMLTNERLIKKSLVLPFRFNTAIKEMEKAGSDRKVIVALSQALEKSLNNVPKFSGKTLVVLDESGSMSGRPIEIGSLFAAVLYKTNDADLMTFSNDARYRNLNPLDSTLTLARRLQEESVYNGTNFHSIFETANKGYDRIIILSDMQGWIGYDTPVKDFKAYKERFNVDPFVYSFDLQGYGDMQFPERQVFCIAGFSDKIFDVMKLLEQDRNALITEIEKIEL